MTQETKDKIKATKARNKALKDAEITTNTTEVTKVQETALIGALSEFNDIDTPTKLLIITPRTPVSISEMHKYYIRLIKAGYEVMKRHHDTSLHFKIDGMKCKLAWVCKNKRSKDLNYEKTFNIVLDESQ